MSRPQCQPVPERPQDLPIKAELARLRVAYVKDRRLAYLGHLDLISTVERCVRRSGLPFSIGNGFARRMRIQFSSALPVGASSACELFDLRLTRRVDVDEALAALRAATPPALAPYRAAYVDGRLPAPEAWLDRTQWSVELGPACPTDELSDAIESVWRHGEIRYLRGEKEKVVDLSRTLLGFRVGEGGGGLTVALDTRSGAGGALRPQVLLDAAFSEMGRPAPDAPRVRRLRQGHEESGRIVEPFGPFDTEARAPLS
ncbi:MAG: TIGR03936 family radical SAM-associated protein [Atopobiaceae bacterium]|nr:TIGR03936 family radical SAM-associated protein [Atopobiaceae bacterium]